MKTIELFAAMAAGRTIEVREAAGSLYHLRIQGMVREDGSGNCWIVLADDVDFDEPLKFFVRTADSADGMVFRYIPKHIKLGY